MATEGTTKREWFERALEAEVAALTNQELADRLRNLGRYPKGFSASERRAYLFEASARLHFETVNGGEA